MFRVPAFRRNRRSRRVSAKKVEEKEWDEKRKKYTEGGKEREERRWGRRKTNTSVASLLYASFFMGVCELTEARLQADPIRLIVVSFQIRRSDNLLSGPGIQVNAQLPLLNLRYRRHVCMFCFINVSDPATMSRSFRRHFDEWL